MPARRFLPQALAAAACIALGPVVAAPPRPAPLEGVVTRVADGGTLQLSPPEGPPVQVKLADIDPLEPCQPGGEEARRALADLALDKPASLRPTGRDGAGRTVGHVVIDGVDVGVRLVEEGHAWSALTRWDRGPLVKQERMAKALGRGVHAVGGAIRPAEFRRLHGRCAAAAPTR